MNLGIIGSIAKKFLDDHNRKLVGCEGVGGLRFYDERAIRASTSSTAGVKKLRGIVKLLAAKKAHDQKVTRQAHRSNEQPAPNVGLEVLLRAVLRALAIHGGIHASLCGPSLLAWKHLSQIPPWETRAHLLVGKVTAIQQVQSALVAYLPPRFVSTADSGGIRVRYACKGKDACHAKFAVLLVFRSATADHPEPSAAAMITKDMAGKIKITERDLLPTSCTLANLSGTVLVPASKAVSRTLHRWYHGGDEKKSLPTIQAPRPWAWSSIMNCYTKTSIPSYYLRPPYGKKTLLAVAVVVVALLVAFACWKLAVSAVKARAEGREYVSFESNRARGWQPKSDRDPDT